MEELKKKQWRKGILIAGNLVFAVFAGVITYLLGRICYLPEWIVWLPGLVVFVLVVVSRVKKKFTWLPLFVLIIVILCSDGRFYGDKLEVKGIMLRGTTSLMMDNRLPVIRDLGATLFPAPEYKEDGTRVSEFKAPDGYTYKQFMQDGVPYEFVEKAGTQNVVLYLHGGAYLQRMSSAYDVVMTAFTEVADVNVLVPDYRIPPEHPYPTDLEDVNKAYLWLIEQGYNPENIVIAGDSAGGGLALALGLYLKEQGQPMPAGFLTFSAWTDLTKREKDYTENKSVETMFKHSKTISQGIDNYLANGASADDPFVSPVYGDFTGFPQMLLQVGNYEILKQNTQAVYDKANSVGVKVTMEAYPGMFHDFQTLKGTLKVADEAWESVGNFLAECFSKTESVVESN